MNVADHHRHKIKFRYVSDQNTFIKESDVHHSEVTIVRTLTFEYHGRRSGDGDDEKVIKSCAS